MTHIARGWWQSASTRVLEIDYYGGLIDVGVSDEDIQRGVRLLGAGCDAWPRSFHSGRGVWEGVTWGFASFAGNGKGMGTRPCTVPSGGSVLMYREHHGAYNDVAGASGGVSEEASGQRVRRAQPVTVTSALGATCRVWMWVEGNWRMQSGTGSIRGT